jgi:hypothetical protein
MQVTIQNQSRIELLPTHLKKIAKVAKAKAENHSTAFEVSAPLNKSTTAVFNLHRLPGKVSVVVTNVLKK